MRKMAFRSTNMAGRRLVQEASVCAIEGTVKSWTERLRMDRSNSRSCKMYMRASVM